MRNPSNKVKKQLEGEQVTTNQVDGVSISHYFLTAFYIEIKKTLAIAREKVQGFICILCLMKSLI